MVVNGVVGLLLVRTWKNQKTPPHSRPTDITCRSVITSIAVLIGLIVVKITGYVWADPICAIAISIYIAWMGIKLVRKSLGGLMDKQDVEDMAQARCVAPISYRPEWGYAGDLQLPQTSTSP